MQAFWRMWQDGQTYLCSRKRSCCRHSSETSKICKIAQFIATLLIWQLISRGADAAEKLMLKDHLWKGDLVMSWSCSSTTSASSLFHHFLGLQMKFVFEVSVLCRRCWHIWFVREEKISSSRDCFLKIQTRQVFDISYNNLEIISCLHHVSVFLCIFSNFLRLKYVWIDWYLYEIIHNMIINNQ